MTKKITKSSSQKKTVKSAVKAKTAVGQLKEKQQTVWTKEQQIALEASIKKGVDAVVASEQSVVDAINNMKN